ncbi:MAG: HAMP domain-containing histidine kinase [Ruminococcaceae bacterium]|nr:HAMP domain-containing histidine kinase [Oscillospiraceae bacterium]
MSSIKSKYKSLYWQQFMLTAGLVLLTLVLLGVSFFALSYNYTLSERRDEMRDRAALMARASTDFLSAEESGDMQQKLHDLAAVASLMSDVNFLICNEQGQALLTTDTSLEGKSVTLPQEIVTDIVAEGVYEGSHTIGVYSRKQVAVGVPVVKGGALIGFVLAVTETTELMEMWRAFFGLFLMTSAIILLISFLATSFLSMRQAQPIQEMVRATRAYAGGDFGVRINANDLGEEMGELAVSFNSMADSLAETERQRRDFIANVSHELKTPMTTIAGYTDGILDGTIPPERSKQYLQIISDESRRLSRLVRRMLDISQIQSLEMRMAEFDLCESMRLALLSMEQRILQRELDVEADIPEDSVLVLGDNDLITQVIYNLLENATKFAAPDSTLYLGLAVGGEKAVVTVRNAGATIPPEEIPLLFERFHKSDKSRSVDKDGYGLGLYIVKTIVEQHKEKITVTSEDGVTAFSFTVQLARPAVMAADKKH